MAEKEKSQAPVAFVAGLVVMGLILASAYFLTRPAQVQQGVGAAGQHLPLGPAERSYAERIHISDIRMSQAVNMLQQEFTYVNGVLANDGTRVIRDIELTVEFLDQFNQVVLRDTQRPFGTALRAGEPLPAGQRREFQLMVEHVPADWNRNYPAVRVSGLVLE